MCALQVATERLKTCKVVTRCRSRVR
jgi:hypothetical protein